MYNIIIFRQEAGNSIIYYIFIIFYVLRLHEHHFLTPWFYAPFNNYQSMNDDYWRFAKKKESL